jgi:glutamine cyclotransferase
MRRLLFLAATLAACTPSNESAVRDAPEILFSVQRVLPHDSKAFTQGLLIHDGELYESTGEDSSWVGIVNVQTGIATKRVVLDTAYFGEGIAILNGKVFQLTWRNKKGFVYRFPSFEKIGEFDYPGEGWGLTTDGAQLIMSDGTDKITFLDTATLKPAKTLLATNAGEPITHLNELEYADGLLYANIWQTDLIARIDLATGEVTGFLDLSDLARQARVANPNADVLNGIAWHPGTRTLLVTGKYWPYLFILKLN